MTDGERPLAGRVAAITGAGQGLGREYAQLLAALGAQVVVNDIRGVEAVVEQIRQAGGEAVAHVADIGDWKGARGLVDCALEAFGRFDVLVNNAGLLRVSATRHLSEQDWEAMLHVNLMGTVAPIQAAIAHWEAERQTGRAVDAVIINTTSETALAGYPGRAPYCAGKAGVAALTVSLATELERIGVRVNAVAPRARTSMSTQTLEITALIDDEERRAGFDSWGPQHVAVFVAYLALPDCPMTGEVFQVAGDEITRYYGWTRGPRLDSDHGWSIAELRQRMPTLLTGVHEGGDMERRRKMAAQLE